MRVWVLLGVLVSLATSHDAVAACPAVFAGGVAPVAPVAVIAICHTDYEAAYAPAWGEPAWSAEHLTADQARAGEATARVGQFHAEAQLGPLAITPADYDRTGYDRGHMAPAGDFGADKPESFSMANMVPQTPNLNRKIWAGIEAAVRARAIADGELYVVTGPQVDANAPRLAGGKIAVPAATWKALYDPAQGWAAAYDCTNTATPVCRQVSIAALASAIGFDPLPGAPAAAKSAAATLPAPTKGGALVP